MSRSWKKTPGFTDQQNSPGWSRFAKRRANKAVRKSDIIDDGAFYKKLYQQYDICDYKFLDFQDEGLPWYPRYKLYIK